ncbi:MAG: acetoacetate decarboxylase family protein [Sulfolobales archaeon]
MGAYTHVITESGRSSIVPEGPYHYGVEYIAVHLKVNSDKAQKLLPKFLRASDEAWIYVADFVTVHGKNIEWIYRVPDMTQYKEAAIALKVYYEGRPYSYFPFMWVDKDWALIRGWLNGYPKKIAEIVMSKINPLNPVLGEISRGTRLGGYCSRLGRRLLTIVVELEEETTEIPLRGFGPTLTYRHFPATYKGQQELSEVLEIIRSNYRLGRAWRGRGEVEIGYGDNDEVDLIEPLSILGGYYYTAGYTIEGGKVIGRH